MSGGSLPDLSSLLTKIPDYSNPSDFLIKLINWLPGLPDKNKIIENLQVLKQYLPSKDQAVNITELSNIANNIKVQNAMLNTLNGFIGSNLTLQDLQELNRPEKRKQNFIGLVLFFILGMIDYFIKKTEGLFSKFFGGEAITVALGATTLSIPGGVFLVLVILVWAVFIALIVLAAFTTLTITASLTVIGIVGLMMLPEILFMLQAGHVNTPAIQEAAKGIYSEDSTYIKDRNNKIMQIASIGLGVMSKGFEASMETLTIIITSIAGLIPFLGGGGVRNSLGDLSEYIKSDQIKFQDVLNNMMVMPPNPSLFDKSMFGFALWVTYVNFYLVCLKNGKRILPKISSINQCMGI